MQLKRGKEVSGIKSGKLEITILQNSLFVGNVSPLKMQASYSRGLLD